MAQLCTYDDDDDDDDGGGEEEEEEKEFVSDNGIAMPIMIAMTIVMMLMTRTMTIIKTIIMMMTTIMKLTTVSLTMMMTSTIVNWGLITCIYLKRVKEHLVVYFDELHSGIDAVGNTNEDDVVNTKQWNQDKSGLS